MMLYNGASKDRVHEGQRCAVQARPAEQHVMTQSPMDGFQAGQDSEIAAILRGWREHTGAVREWRSLYQKGTVLDVTAESGTRYVLKEVAKGQPVGRRLERLASEHRLLLRLHACGVPVPTPLAAEDGLTYVRHPEDEAAVYTLHRRLPSGWSEPALPGEVRAPQWDVPQTWTNVGAAIGRLHRALAAYPGEIVSWHMVLPERIRENALPQTRGYLEGKWQAQLAQLDAVFTPELTDEVCVRLADLPEQHVHGDCHGGNVLVCDCDVSGFIDMDHLPLGARVYDLFYMLADRMKWRVYDPEGLATTVALFPHLAEGYRRENTLTARERGALWPGMLATQLFFVQVYAHNGNAEHLARNLDALTWIHRHRDELERLLGEEPWHAGELTGQRV